VFVEFFVLSSLCDLEWGLSGDMYFDEHQLPKWWERIFPRDALLHGKRAANK